MTQGSRANISVKTCNCAVPEAQKIRRVRKIRNAAMHDVTYPTFADVSDCRTYTKNFLQQLVTNVWGVSFDSVSLTDLVKNPRVKAFLSQAEQSWAMSDRGEAIVNAMAAFRFALSKAQKTIVGDIPRKFNVSIMSDNLVASLYENHKLQFPNGLVWGKLE
jgi:hypothetical protein